MKDENARLRKALWTLALALALWVVTLYGLTCSILYHKEVYGQDYQPRAIVFVLDGSGSIDGNEWEIQKQGIIRVLRDPDAWPVLQGVKVGVIQFSNRAHVISHLTDHLTAASLLEPAQQVASGTCVPAGLDAAWKMLRTFPGRKIVDVSGDGIEEFCGTGDNYLRSGQLKDAMTADGIEINGLTIEDGNKFLTEWYRQEVVNGFVIPIQHWEDYYHAMRQKILLEIS